MICWKCKSDIGEFDNYCKYCGAGQGKYLPIYYKHIGIILLFFILGPFNLYFAWRSPALKRPAKIIYTFVFLALTGWVCYKSYLLFLQAKEMLSMFPSALIF